MKRIRGQMKHLCIVCLTLAMIVSSIAVSFVASADSTNVIDGQNSQVTVTILKNGEVVETGDAIARGDMLNVTLSIAYRNDVSAKPTTDQLDWTYAIPSELTILSNSSGELLDGIVHAGSYNISDNVITFHYDESWVSLHNNDMTTQITLNMQLNNDELHDDNDYVFAFPGQSTTDNITVSIPDNISANKYSDYQLDENGYVSYTIDLNLDGDVDNFVLTDTLGSNLSFIQDSFMLDGTSIQNVSISGNDAVLTLGNLGYGSHKITYKVQLNDDVYPNSHGQFDNVSNEARWTYNTNDNGHVSSQYPGALSTNMVSKSGSYEDGLITWIVRVNSGSYKMDMSGFTFTDTLQGTNHQYSGNLQVYQGTYNSVSEVSELTPVDTVGLSSSDDSFVYTFDNDAGEKAYTLIYQTQADAIQDEFVTEIYRNDGDLQKDDHHYQAESQVRHEVAPEGIFAKEIVNQDGQNRVEQEEDGSTYGYVNWKVTFDLSQLNGREISNFTITDYLSNRDHIAYVDDSLQVFLNDNTTAVDSSLYNATFDPYNTNSMGSYNLTINNFSSTLDLSHQDTLTITYTTKDDGYTNGTTGTGEYNNNARYAFTMNGIDYNEDVSASYTIQAFRNLVNKSGYQHDGIITWQVYGNVATDQWGNIQHGQGANDYQGQTVTVTDTLPAGLNYVEDSGVYSLTDPWNTPTTKIHPTVVKNEDGTTTLTFEVENVHQDEIHLRYDTSIDESALRNPSAQDGQVVFRNDVDMHVGETSLGSAFHEESVRNNILNKYVGSQNGQLVNYTIDVNQNGYDLMDNEDVIVLEDVLDYRTSIQTQSIVIFDTISNEDITSQCQIQLETVVVEGNNTQKLTIIVPDETAIKITYRVALTGQVGDYLENVVNSATLIGQEGSYQDNQVSSFTVASSSASASGTTDSITITKVDAYNPIDGFLRGAEFELHRYSGWNETLTDTVVATGTSDMNGTVRFSEETIGETTTKLHFNELYYFVETKAPTYIGETTVPSDDPYLLDQTKHYFVLMSNEEGSAQEYQTLITNIENQLGTTVVQAINNSYNYTITNETAGLPTSINLQATKYIDLNGVVQAPTAQQQFTFELDCISAPDGVAFEKMTTTNTLQNIQFSDITLNQEGHYTFVLKEASQQTLTGYAYDQSEYHIDVDVEKKTGVNELEVVQTTYSKVNGAALDSIESDALTFTNSRVAVGSLTVTKSLVDSQNNPYQGNGDFYFGIYNQDDQLVGQIHHLHLSNENQEAVTVDNLPIGQYTIYETDINGNILGDSFEHYNVLDGQTVVIEENLTAQTTITNQLKAASGEYAFGGTKNMLGREFEAGDSYTFAITSPHNNYSETVTIQPTSGTVETFTFNPDQFDETDIDKYYRYTISEQTGSLEGVTYDTKTYNWLLVVTDDDYDGVLEFKAINAMARDDIESSLTPTEMSIFNNAYQRVPVEDGYGVFALTKVMANRQFKNNETFTFTLSVDKHDGQGYQVIQTLDQMMDADKSEQTFKFDDVILTEADLDKQYTYKIEEISGRDGTVVYDKTIYEGTYDIVESEDDEGTRVASLEFVSGVDVQYQEPTLLDSFIQFFAGPGQQNATFTNTATQVEITKTDITSGQEVVGAHLQIIDANGDVVDDWISDENTHVIIGELIAGETYTLHEEGAPDGYGYASDIQFTVNDNGEVNQVEMQDRATSVEVSKLDATGGNEVIGAHLQIIDAQTNLVVEEWDSTNEVHVVSGLLVDHDYILHESLAPAGYNYASDITFTINHDGSVNQIEMIDEMTEVTISKMDITGTNEVAGALLQIIDSSGVTVEEWTSTDQPYTITGELIAGETYILHEEGAPNGYGYAADIEFTVGGDGRPTYVTMYDDVTKVHITKTDITGENEVAGAFLQIIDKDGQVVEEWTSSDNVYTITGELIAGETYTLHEEGAPNGYGYASDIQFVVNLNGEINSVVMRDDVTKVEISKTDITGDQELPGAHLQIFDKNGELVDEWISTDEKHLIIGELIAGETYTLHEEGAPEGYNYASDITFTVNRDGSVTQVHMIDTRIGESITSHEEEKPKEEIEKITTLDTGDQTSYVFEILTMMASFVGFILLKRRKVSR